MFIKKNNSSNYLEPNYYYENSKEYMEKLNLSYLDEIQKIIMSCNPMYVLVYILNDISKENSKYSLEDIRLFKSDLSIFKSLGYWSQEIGEKYFKEIIQRDEFYDKFKTLPILEKERYYNKLLGGGLFEL